MVNSGSSLVAASVAGERVGPVPFILGLHAAVVPAAQPATAGAIQEIVLAISRPVRNDSRMTGC
jgi:hypothetical protein